jgi:hypothetical protein
MKAYELFEILASKTWKSIERCARNRIHLGEDAITTNNLDALASAGPCCVVIEDTRAKEDTTGCDFELWIGSDHRGWFRYAVQAKKIQVANDRYASLKHKVGKAGKLQIDILEDYSKLNRAIPIYCFYNNSNSAFKWNCNLPTEKEQLGVSITPSSVVRKAITKSGCRTFSYIHGQPETLPWRCLVACPHLVDPTKAKNSKWSHISDGYYKELPKVLASLRETTSRLSFEQIPDLFSRESDLRPEWIGIIDVGKNSSRR